MLQNDLLLKAATGKIVKRPPVWVMRQAGRILPEYRAIRNSLSGFKELVTTPDLAAEVTIQPVDILGVDAAIIFSDILVIPEALGLDYEMLEKVGPRFPKTINSEADIAALNESAIEDKLSYVTDAISETKKRLDGRVPLIGFAGAPWTIMCYMIEGGGSKTFSKARKMLWQQEAISHDLLNKITSATITYLKAQIAAGANIVQVFDSWAAVLSPDLYRKYCIPYLKRICDEIQEVPVIVFAKGANYSIEDIARLDCNVIGLDWTIPVAEAREMTNASKTLQGNLDPTLLYADEETIVSKTKQMVNTFGTRQYIANLGHGVYPDTDPMKVKLFIDTIKSGNYE